MKFLKKNWSNLIFGVFIIAMIIPQTRMPIQVFLQRIISFSPSEIEKEDRLILTDYNWELTSLNSEDKNLAQSEGKVVFINVWATWCPPCIAEMPDLQKVYDAYGDQVDFYFITNDTSEKVNLFLNNRGYDLPVFFPSKKAPKLLVATSLPTTFLIAKNGEILIKKVGTANWNSSEVHESIDKLLVD